jgi:hypothetical protein
MFLIDIPFKGCQGRSNHSSIVHAVSYFACCVNDTTCTVHAVSLTPHAFFIFFAHHGCFAYDFHFSKLFGKFFFINDTACILKIPISSWIRIYIRKSFSLLIRGPGGMFWWKKTEGQKSRDTVPLTKIAKIFTKMQNLLHSPHKLLLWAHFVLNYL